MMFVEQINELNKKICEDKYFLITFSKKFKKE